MLRPMRPNPLIPTLTAIDVLRRYAARVTVRSKPSDSNERACAVVKPTAILRVNRDSSTACTPSTASSSWRSSSWCRRTSLYQAIRYRKYIGSLRAAARLPAGLVQPRRRGVDLDSRRVGRRGADRPRAAAELRERYPRLRLFLSTTTMTGQQVARQQPADVDAVFYFPFDWASSSAARCGW